MRIKVNTIDEYEILSGMNLVSGDKLSAAERLSDEFKELFLKNGMKPNRAAIIWDEKIDPEPVEIVGSSLEHLGLDCLALSVKGGEEAKTIETYKLIIGHLDNFKMDKHDLIVAIGGGTVTDLAGFTASTFMRGLSVVYVPTTLLGMVDAAIGGKNALNLGLEKNIIGTIYQPKMVIVEPKLLNKLPEKEFKSGVSEVIKAGIIGDSKLLEFLKNNSLWDVRGDEDKLNEAINSAIMVKKTIIESDENEENSRAILNFGHTYGHAIESQSGFKISHGYAVSIGMVLMTKYAINNFGLESEALGELKEVLKKNGLPTDSPMDRKTLKKAIRRDKKAHGDRITIALPKGKVGVELKEVEIESL